MVIVESAVVDNLLRLFGLTTLSALVAMLSALLYRWYVRDRIPPGVTLLAGVAAVALYLNTRGALGAVAEGEIGYLSIEAVVFNTVAFLTAGAITPLGQRVGDRIATNSLAFAEDRTIEGDVGTFVKTVGRLTAVTLPETIEAIDGYDPVPESVTETLAGRTLLFPNRVTSETLRDRLVARLKADYDVGYVDVDLAADGTVEYLAVGRRIAGIGPTLGPGTGAVAITADPPHTAGTGDLVQVWEPTEDGCKRLATAEIRGVSGDVVTIALDDHDARSIAGSRYRLVTLPVTPDAEREFAGLLRAADETMAVVEVAPDSDLDGRTVGDVGATVVAVKPATGAIEPIPARSRRIEGGDLVYVVARPGVIRRLESRSTMP